jgi:hypothetical protein
VLLVVDMTVMRHGDRFDARLTSTGEGAYREGSTEVWAKAKTPILVRVAAAVSFMLGVLGFPATLAPVVLTVLAFRQSALMSDGWVSLVVVFLAGIAMSVAIKQMRVAHLLLSLRDEMSRLLKQTIAYLLVWVFIVWILFAGATLPSGHVTTIVWSYLGALTVGVALTALGVKTALQFVSETAAPDAVEKSGRPVVGK